MSLLNKLLGFELEVSHANRVATDLGEKVEQYYAQRPALKKGAEEGEYLAIGFDGKGVPIVKYDREEQKDGQGGRLMKGQKRGVKKEATVALSFSFNPVKRTAEDVLKGLFKERSSSRKKDKRISINVHKRAFMCAQKETIEYGVKHALKRNPDKDKRIIALVDCGAGLEQGILEKITKQGLQDNLDAIIADIVHVSEYIWDAANVILGEKYKGRTRWVRAMMKDLLQTNTEQVIKSLIDNRDKTNLSPSQKKQLNRVIRYLNNHKHKMDYKSYLEKGYPISTGLIEGACGHLVKNRMEGNGKRWTIKGAQNMLDIRAVKKNDDWDDFMAFVQNSNKPNLVKMRA